MHCFRSNVLVFILPCLLHLVSSCTTVVEEQTPFGITPTKTGYVPARIALTNCLIWPDRASRIKGMPMSNVQRADMQKLCVDFDQFVAAGFDNQPFMKGLSPKLVEKFYNEGGSRPPLADAIAQHWQHRTEDCDTCRTAAAFYNGSIAPRKPWGIWLAEFAAATKGSDALLLPLLIFNATSRVDDRGLITAKRSAAVVLFLIDTNSGELIWSGGREADAVSKVFADDPRSRALDPPDQDELKKRLFTDALWLEFPGRQIYK